MFAPCRLAPLAALILLGGAGMSAGLVAQTGVAHAQSIERQIPPGFHDQRYAAPKLPGRSPSLFRQLRRENDVARRYSGENVQVTRDIAIRQGRAFLFRSTGDVRSEPEISGTLEGKGAYLTITWPP